MRVSPVLLSRRLSAPFLVTASLVVAVSGPVATTNAQMANQASLDLFKQRITTAIDSSLAKLKQSSESLNFSITLSADKDGVTTNVSGNSGSASSSVSKDGVTAQVNGSKGGSASVSAGKDGASGSVTTGKGGTASGSVSKDGAEGSASNSKGSSASGSVSSDGANATIDLKGGGLTGLLSVPKELKTKLQESNQKAIDKLTALKEKVQATASLEDVQAKAKEFDQEFKEIATANVQATVTKSIDSMTQVLDRLQVASDSLQTRVDKLKECIQAGSLDASVTAQGANVSASSTADDCASLNVAVNAGDGGTSLDEKLAEAKSTMQTIRSFLSSSIGLIAQLKDGNYTGTIKSFQGISAQVDVVASLSSDVQNDLLNLSVAINK